MAKITVYTSPEIAPFLSPATIAWCDQVTVAPELSSIIVFKKGICQASKGSIPIGGQTDPNSGVGETLEWKKAQRRQRRT